MKKLGFVAIMLLMISNIVVYAGDWKSVPVPDVASNWTLQGVCFPTADIGWAVGFDFSNKKGQKGVIIKYEGGKWVNIALPEVSGKWTLRAVDFVSENEGWAVGEDMADAKGTILHYKDGNWTKTEPPSTSLDGNSYELRDVKFVNASEGYAVGGNDGRKGAIILHYKDGIWKSVGEELLGKHNLRGLTLLSSTDIWAGGQNEGKVVGITNMDRPWGCFEVHSDGNAFTQVKQPTLLKNVVRCDYHFFAADNGFVLGFFPTIAPNYVGRVLQWNGEKWKNIKLDYNSKWWFLNAFAFSSEKNGWAVGSDNSKDKGIIVEYSKKGWVFVGKKGLPEISKDWGLYDITYIVDNEYWAVGTDHSGKKGIILHYTD